MTKRSLLFISLFLFSFQTLFAADDRDPMQPLRVNSSGRYFETNDGKPWFWLGDTAWPLVVSYTPQEAETYLAARAKTGFTIIQAVAVWDGGTGTEKGDKPNPNVAGVQPWASKDPLKPNEAYWKNVDAVVAMAEKHGLYLGLLPAWGSYVTDTKMITSSNAEAYGRWLGQRYKDAPNLVWITGGDRKVEQAPEIWKAIAHGLQEGDGGIHPITFHPGLGKKATSSALHNEPWLAANMIQTWGGYTDIPSAVAADYAKRPPKPVILAEGAYEDGPEYPTKPITPLKVRKQAYWAYLSGGFSTYGHNDMWRKNPTWQRALDSEGAKDMRVLRGVFKSLAWWTLQPDQAIFASGEGKDANYNVAARSTDGRFALIYITNKSKFQLNLDQIKGEQLRLTWIDPTNGQQVDEKTVARNEKVRLAKPKQWDDALLLVLAETASPTGK